jgi:hypothetical protein
MKSRVTFLLVGCGCKQIMLFGAPGSVSVTTPQQELYNYNHSVVSLFTRTRDSLFPSNVYIHEGEPQDNEGESRKQTVIYKGNQKSRRSTVIYTGRETDMLNKIVELNEDTVEVNNNRIDNGMYKQVCKKRKEL